MAPEHDFPTGAKLDTVVAVTIAQLERDAADVWSSEVVFYALLRYGLQDFHEDMHYAALVRRSIERLQAAGLVRFDPDGVSGYRLTRTEG
jgi:hypothetical protein